MLIARIYFNDSRGSGSKAETPSPPFTEMHRPWRIHSLTHTNTHRETGARLLAVRQNATNSGGATATAATAAKAAATSSACLPTSLVVAAAAAAALSVVAAFIK